MSRYEFPLAFICLCALWTSIHSVELTFELADNERQCFYEQLQLGSKFVLEFQVCLTSFSMINTLNCHR